MDYRGWSEQDLEELDQKFDALCEYFGVEFVFTKISDGSDRADIETVTVRKKTPPQITGSFLGPKPHKGRNLPA